MKHSSKRRSSDHAEPNPEEFLQLVGDRVRMMRNRRGMSRKALANYSDVSQRYIAQLEAGEGNCSIVLLRRIAKAIGVQLMDLVDQRPDRQMETVLLEQFIGRLSPSQLTEARDLLVNHFEGRASARRRERIAFVGLRGAGKSTLGKLLAARLKRPFIELDRIIEQQNGMTLAEIFEMFGQETFRRSERTALEASLSAHPSFVLATGGGLVAEAATYELMLTSCLTVWVKAAPEEHMQRVVKQGDLRPMAKNAKAMDDLVSILRSREALYARADIVLDTTGLTAEQALDDLMARIDVPRLGRARRSA
jgi:XRE family aerobic/anaerobic benzoate catabolism transcriptional regulator